MRSLCSAARLMKIDVRVLVRCTDLFTKCVYVYVCVFLNPFLAKKGKGGVLYG